MGLIEWPESNDPFNHAQLASNFNKLDSHKHGPGEGQQIESSGIANRTILGTNIALSTIEGQNIASNTIHGNNIVNGTITSNNIAPYTINSNNLSVFTLLPANVQTGVIEEAHGKIRTLPEPPKIEIASGLGYASPGLSTTSYSVENLILVKWEREVFTIPSNSSGHPRIDQIIIPEPSYWGATVKPQYVIGTPTNEANLNNRQGAVSEETLESTYFKWILIADIMVPNGFGTTWGTRNSATLCSYTDRRRWALGAHFQRQLLSEETSSTTPVLISPSTTRLETINGESIIMGFMASIEATANTTVVISTKITGSQAEFSYTRVLSKKQCVPGINQVEGFMFGVPAGVESTLFEIYWQTSAGTIKILNEIETSSLCKFYIKEDISLPVNNGTI